MTILVACGLTREAKILRGVGMIPVAGGGDSRRLEDLLEDAIVALGPFDAIVSAGIAGALDPMLKPGDVVIGTLAATPNPVALSEVEVRATNAAPGARASTTLSTNGVADSPSALVEMLRAKLPEAHVGTIAGSDSIAATLNQKRTLRETTGAIAVDMESHVAARIAARHDLPFAILRTISDGADHVLPPAALVGMKPDGGMALGAVLASLACRPGQLPALIRTGRDAERAFRALAKAAEALAGVAGST